MSQVLPHLQMLFPGIKGKSPPVPAPTPATPSATARPMSRPTQQPGGGSTTTGSGNARRRVRGGVSTNQRLSGTKQLLGD